MRGFLALSTGGAIPPRGSGDGKRGATSFSSSKSGSVTFKGGAPGSIASQKSAIFKAAYTCAGLGVVGDLLAQTITKSAARKKALTSSVDAKGAKGGSKTSKAAVPVVPESPYDLVRTARQLAYNFAFYGPAQHFWYAALASKFPTAAGASFAKNFSPFIMKVFLNQAVLGPIVVATFFGWSMALTGQAAEYPKKMKNDALPTLKRGWAFWVPAASVNFAFVPLKAQVLYMSCCSIVWNYILSTAAAGGEKKVEVVQGKKK
jgi:protein Mpv17